MLSDIVLAGQTVEIQEANKSSSGAGGAEGRKVYRTRVFEVLDEERLEIIMPMEKENLIRLQADTEYDLCFYAEKGLYQCFAKVTDRYKSKNIYILVMELSSNLRKLQRREYYRLNCALEMKSRELDDDEIAAVLRQQFYLVPGLPMKKSVIIDISGGGIRFIANFHYPQESMIYCNYSLPINNEMKQYHLVGKVLLVKELEKRPGVYEHRVQFVNMDVDAREDIIKYIFQEERKQRHKGKG